MKLGALEERMQSERRGRNIEVRCRCHSADATKSHVSLRAAFKALTIQLQGVDKPIFLVGFAKG